MDDNVHRLFSNSLVQLREMNSFYDGKLEVPMNLTLKSRLGALLASVFECAGLSDKQRSTLLDEILLLTQGLNTTYHIHYKHDASDYGEKTYDALPDAMSAIFRWLEQDYTGQVGTHFTTNNGVTFMSPVDGVAVLRASVIECVKNDGKIINIRRGKQLAVLSFRP